jgi:hypothetical protein
MSIDDEDSKRRQLLSEIWGITRHGIVDGVEFDLRHELLEPSEWQTATIGMESPPYFIRYSDPLIWFPWYGEFSESTLRREAELYYEAEKDRRLGKSDHKLRGHEHMRRTSWLQSVEEYVINGTPECTVCTGDKIVIKDVQRRVFEEERSAFTHPHDYETRYARLSVIRSNGKVELIETPIPFQGTTALFRPGSYETFFDRICRRITQHERTRPRTTGEIRIFPSFDALSAQMVERRTGEFRKLAASGDPDDPLIRNAADACFVIAQAVRLGYLWAQTEAEFELKPLARLARRVKAGATSGGSKSGQERRRKRATTWEAIAKKMIMEIRAENPTFSQDKVADEIFALWQHEDPRAPGHATLKGLISRMEQAGELPKRRRT